MQIQVQKTSKEDFPLLLKFALPKGLGLPHEPEKLFSQPPRGTETTRKKFVIDTLKKVFRVKKINASDFKIDRFTASDISVLVNPKHIGGKSLKAFQIQQTIK